MVQDVVEVRALDNYRLFLRFSDGQSGEVDLTNLVPFEGVFAPLRDPAKFAEVKVNPDTGTVEWPNRADIDPVVLYCWATGRPLPDRSGAKHEAESLSSPPENTFRQNPDERREDMARYAVLNEFEVCDHDGWKLFVQLVKDVSGEEQGSGARFIWKDPTGNMLPQRGQARIPQFEDLRYALDEMIRRGWDRLDWESR
jgi:hypothetical protein